MDTFDGRPIAGATIGLLAVTGDRSVVRAIVASSIVMLVTRIDHRTSIMEPFVEALTHVDPFSPLGGRGPHDMRGESVRRTYSATGDAARAHRRLEASDDLRRGAG